MDRRDFLKKGMQFAGGLIASAALSDLAKGQDTNPASRNEYCRKNYTRVQWILNKNGEQIIYGDNNLDSFSKGLEEMAFTDRNPKEIELTEWDTTTLAKLVPVKRMIEQHSAYYAIHPMWATMFFTLESLLKPADHNKKSEDFGIGQIKLTSEKLAKRLGTAPNNKFYSPSLDKEKSIFDPETNIIMSMLLHRYNIETENLNNSDQTYAVYVRGRTGLSWWSKNPNDLTKERLDALHKRHDYYKNVLPLFRLTKEQVAEIKSPDTRTLMELYHSNLEPREVYRKELDYFLNDVEGKATGDARSVLVYDDCATFFKTLELAYGETPRDYRRRILEVGRGLSKIVTNKELKNRVDKATQILRESG